MAAPVSRGTTVPLSTPRQYSSPVTADRQRGQRPHKPPDQRVVRPGALPPPFLATAPATGRLAQGVFLEGRGGGD